MCGIFGMAFSRTSSVPPALRRPALDALFLLSETRGREAAGVAVRTSAGIGVMKCPDAASRLIRRRDYRAFLKRLTSEAPPASPMLLMGHSRLVTNGLQDRHENNQPVIQRGIVTIHNGIVTNVDALRREEGIAPPMSAIHGAGGRAGASTLGSDRRLQDAEGAAWPPAAEPGVPEVDTAILPVLLRRALAGTDDLALALGRLFSRIEGASTFAMVFEDAPLALLATNNGSLYAAHDDECLVFASEEYILRTALSMWPLVSRPLRGAIRRLQPGSAWRLDLDSFELIEGSWRDGASCLAWCPAERVPIADLTPEDWRRPAVAAVASPTILVPRLREAYPESRAAVSRLRRCTRCILPETMPFIDFDDAGVCNFCRNHHPVPNLGLEALEEAVAPFRRRDGGPEALVTFSGGRDSSYGLHLVREVLKLDAIAYSYDWGMITDLARRNQMRMCGALGVEHILVSADIARKRSYIRKNVTAWLKRPRLGTIPLFMAGDKQYFYHANRIGRQTGCRLVILCENLLETTSFKSGFCGIPPSFGAEHTYTLSLKNKFSMAAYYGAEYLANPAYLNTSLLDTLDAFRCYYFMRHDYLNVYQYLPWNEDEIERVLLGQYNWEVSPDTKSTWRIGDGTASFYNYIYYMMAGFTENDTFRSNQVREGMLDRATALELAERDNEPRYDSIRWYCDTIGVDASAALDAIHTAPRLYCGKKSDYSGRLREDYSAMEGRRPRRPQHDKKLMP